MTNKNIKTIAAGFLAVASSMLGACVEAKIEPMEDTKPMHEGYVEVSHQVVKEMPAEPITAVVGVGNRVFAQVDSPAACIKFAQEAQSVPHLVNSGSGDDSRVSCVARDGAILVIGHRGRVYAKQEVLAP